MMSGGSTSRPVRTARRPIRDPGRRSVDDPEAPALIVYTSGTTGPPKGVVLPRRAIAASLDDLADAWAWTDRDVLVHGLPLFHVHGLVLGTLGPLRLGGALRHLGSFSPEGVAAALAGPATMLFGVPTMYHRLAAAAEDDPAVAEALGRARLLVSGSAPLSVADHERIERASGQRVVERYGMTETLMICAIRADGERRAGAVGLPLKEIELRLLDEDGSTIEAADGTTVGEVLVRGPSLFLEYLNRPDATTEAFLDGWFRTGDVAVRESDGYIRLIGRQSVDLIKSGGFKIGAGEIEAALLEYPGVREAAVTGEPDPDLGERIVAWVVPETAAEPPAVDGLTDHVARLLTPHKRPRAVRYPRRAAAQRARQGDEDGAPKRAALITAAAMTVDAVIAGHVSLDVFPELFGPLDLEPGRLNAIGPATFSTGGAVSNTGLAMRRLGVDVRLVGKVGDDLFGQAVIEAYRAVNPALADGLTIAPSATTSYTIVINPPLRDRSYLHCSGANETFAADDVRDEHLAGARLFHFGYPPLMPRMYADRGRELRELFDHARHAGLVTSLDLSLPDPSSAAGRADWRSVFATALPAVDVFAPSLDELLFMLDRPRYDDLAAGSPLAAVIDRAYLFEVSGTLIALGSAVVAIKLGEHGLYLRTTADRMRLHPVVERLGLARRGVARP